MKAGPLPPHQARPVTQAGPPLSEAAGALVMVHGRGGGSDDILALGAELGREDFALLAADAAGQTWYPYRYLAPLAQNEPWLSSALALLGDLLAQVEAAGVPAERTVLAGFSQGSCLLLEYAVRNPRRYGGLIAFSGGVIGPPGRPRELAGSLAGTPAFLGCSDHDPHILRESVAESAALLTRLGGEVTERIYRGLGHTINEDEILHARRLLQGVAPRR